MKSLRISVVGNFFIILSIGVFLHNNAFAVTTINFDSPPYTLISTGGDITPDTGSVLTDQFMNDGLIFGLPGTSAGVAVVQAESGAYAPSSGYNSVAGLDASGVLPGTINGATVGDIYFSFVLPGTLSPGITDYVSFSIGDGALDNDVFDIRAYDLADTMIYDQHFENFSRFNVPLSVAGINRVEIDFTGSFGYSMDDLTFNTPAVAPEPVSSILFIAGSVTLGIRQLRKKNRRI